MAASWLEACSKPWIWLPGGPRFIRSEEGQARDTGCGLELSEGRAGGAEVVTTSPDPPEVAAWLLQERGWEWKGRGRPVGASRGRLRGAASHSVWTATFWHTLCPYVSLAPKERSHRRRDSVLCHQQLPFTHSCLLAFPTGPLPQTVGPDGVWGFPPHPFRPTSPASVPACTSRSGSRLQSAPSLLWPDQAGLSLLSPFSMASDAAVHTRRAYSLHRTPPPACSLLEARDCGVCFFAGPGTSGVLGEH